MPLALMILAVLTLAAPASAQTRGSSSSGALKSATEDTSVYDWPVSLERIREGLSNAPERSLLDHLDREPDFRSEIQIQAAIDALLSTFKDVKSGPIPFGGVYAYEQQQRLFNSVNNPLMQPYAAFSAGQLITLAVEGLVQKYLGGKALNAVDEWQRARALDAARTEVNREIAAYCAAQPGGGAALEICNAQFTSR